MKLALCGNVSKKTKIKSDLLSKNFEDIFQWSQTISENIKVMKNGPDVIRTHDLSISEWFISRTLQPS